MNGRMTPGQGRAGAAALAAAMEPADERPDDREAVYEVDSTVRAAMEPADERPDDPQGPVGSSTGIVPQWSRPMNGRMTRLGAARGRRGPVRRNGAGR